MKSRLLLLALTVTFSCTGEGVVDDTAADTDTDTDTDTDVQGDGNDSFADADAVTFDADGIFLGIDSIEAPGDRDFYSVPATEGMWYLIWAAGYTDGTGNPDTVVRVYDGSETFVGENDDMPYRWYGTDAGYMFRATTTGTYYVEVLEWSDWAEDTPLGQPTWEYDFIMLEAEFGELQEDNTADGYDNDSLAEADTVLATLQDGDQDNNAFFFYGDPWGAGFPFSTGDMGESGDLDVYGTWADSSTAEYTGEVCQFSFFPEVASDLDAEFVLTDADGNIVAETDAPDVTPDYKVFYDAGITFPIGPSGGEYYLNISDASDNFGTSYAYALIHVCYPATFTGSTPSVVQANIAEGDADGSLTTTEYAGGGGRFGRLAGFMDDQGGGADVDTWTVPTGGAATMDITMDVLDAGSALVDAEVSVYQSNGTTLITSTSGANPALTGVNVSGQGIVYIEVTSTSGYVGLDAYYLALVTLDD